MSELVIVVSQSSSLLSDSNFAGKGNSSSDTEADETVIRVHVPEQFRNDSELLLLFSDYRKERALLFHQIRILRQRLAETGKDEQVSLAKEIRTLLSSNLNIERNFKRAVRNRLRTLRKNVTDPA